MRHRQKPPVPFDESLDTEKRWKPDPYDFLLPQDKGFVSDFIYSTRGVASPTLFSIWAALFTVSSILKRDAWIEWIPDKPLYPNLYLIFIGTAGIVKKSTSIEKGRDVIDKALDKIRNPNVRTMKEFLKKVDFRETPEGFLDTLRPAGEEKPLVDGTGEPMLDMKGRPIMLHPTSEAAIIVDEMSTLINRREYNKTFIETMLQFYDCPKSRKIRTRKDGEIILNKIFLNFFGGTTISGFKDSISESALGDGFLSRTMFVYQRTTTRVNPRPFVPKMAPTLDDLAERLAYIAENTQGEHQLSEEATEWYDNWYMNYHHPDLEARGRLADVFGRRDIILMKVGLMMKAQRFSSSSKIEKQDLIDAEKLIRETYNSAPLLLQEIGGYDFVADLDRVKRYLQKKGELKRVELMRAKHINAEVLNNAIRQLKVDNKIEIYNPEGGTEHGPSSKMEEVYKWIGKPEEEDPQ